MTTGPTPGTAEADGSDPGPARQAALAAARAVLDAHRHWVTGDSMLVEASAWLLASAGEAVPELLGAQDEVHARLAAAAGRDDADALMAHLRDHLPTDAGRRLLVSACRLAGRQWPARLVEVAAAHPGRELDGRWLVGTPDPEALLALLPWSGTGPPDGLTAATLGGLVIAGHDRGEVHAPAQAWWAALQAARPEHLAAYRDPALRLAARGDLEAAVALLVGWEERFGRDHDADGAHAVIARLAQVDPERAVTLVTAGAEPADRTAWLPGLAWWLELAPAAEPLVRRLLALQEPEIDIDLVRLLAGTSDPGLLSRAVAGAEGGYSTLAVAAALAGGVRRWSCAVAASGSPVLAETAGRVRAQCRSFLPTHPPPGGVMAATDVLEVLSAAQPWRYPWDPAPPGMP